ncbi:hypothetical protein C6P41_004416 [Kluyveromyces marxianus]|nr:hypothetical protein C6P43_001318 [Kluyveromyces marxianus]KAG0681385.1 hypothetical protein C6P41_004416 [Kluyveromyces marxianus]
MIRFTRAFRTFAPVSSKSVSNRIIIPPVTQVNYGQPSLKALQSEYKQLPDNSNFIEKYYNELQTFRDEFLVPHLNKQYTDFEENPDDLVFEIEKYIECQVIPKHSVYTQKSDLMAQGEQLPMVYCDTVGDKMIIERFLDFCRGVRHTLRLNGGHSVIFDIMLQSNSVFEDFERRRASS